MMVKQLLLGAAAALAVTSAQAADLPVKAKPVEYVKVCSLYGAGFFYIPGTDTCIRIGGHIRAEYNVGGTGGYAHAYAPGDGLATRTRDRNLYHSRARAYIYHDTRTQTAYGTVRTYSHIRTEVASPYGTGGASTGVSLEAAIIQWGGFTAGRNQASFMHSPHVFAYKYSTIGEAGVTDTPVGRNVLAYTHQFGNGMSGTIALEDPKGSTKRGIYNGLNALAGVTSSTPGVDVRGGNTMPDIIGALRVDQAWGTFWLAGLLTNNHVAYNCGAPSATCTDVSSGKPVDDKLGGAVNASLKFNVPTGRGDAIYLLGGYGVGATSHVFSNLTQGSTYGYYGDRGIAGLNGSLALGYIFDTVYDSRTGVNQQLTTAYGGTAAFEHFWNPQLRTSVFGGAMFLDYNSTANNILCGRLAANLTLGGRSCNMDFRVIQAGSRTVWEPVKDLTFGLEFTYSNLSGKMNGAVYNQVGTVGYRPGGSYLLKNQDVYSGTVSIRRFF